MAVKKDKSKSEVVKPAEAKSVDITKISFQISTLQQGKVNVIFNNRIKIDELLADTKLTLSEFITNALKAGRN